MQLEDITEDEWKELDRLYGNMQTVAQYATYELIGGIKNPSQLQKFIKFFNSRK